MLDPTLAPPGFYAVLKNTTPPTSTVNICTFCDWRKECQQWRRKYTYNSRYRCMPWAREDEASVIFKRCT